MEELWELFDIDGNSSGITIKRKEKIPEGLYHIAADIWIKDTDGKILLTKRHPDKLWGGLWEPSGGAVCAGESPEAGAVRELFEEVGIMLDPSDLTFIRRHVTEQCIMFTYTAVVAAGTAVVMQPEEVVDNKWITKEELDALEGAIVPSVWERYLDYRDLL